MSRSYKRTPCVKDYNPGSKAQANRKARRAKIVGQNGDYKKLFESWNISDYKFCYNDMTALMNALKQDLADDELRAAEEAARGEANGYFSKRVANKKRLMQRFYRFIGK